MRERTRWAVAAALTVAIALGFAADTLAWRAQSQTWLHSDGIIHLERMRVYASALRGEPVQNGIDLLVGYGPVPYQAAARVLVAAGTDDWATASVAWIGFGALGVLGTALLAARLGGPWAAPTAAALLVGLPVWRTHSVDLLVDGPGAATAALALGALAWSDGLRRPGWSVAAGFATGTALACRWPGAFLLGPAWAAAVLVAAGRGQGPRWLRPLGVLAVGLVTGGLIVGPVLTMDNGLGAGARLGLAGAAGLAGLAAAFLSPRDERGWFGRTLGAGLAVVANAWPAVLWAPGGFRSAMESQVAMEEDIAQLATAAPGIVGGLPDVLPMLVAWWTGPLLATVVLVGMAVALRRRPVAAGVVALGAIVNLLVPLELLAQPDERHLFASLPVLVAFAGALATGRAAPAVGPALGAVGLLGLLGWHAPALPGVVPSSPWQRDINLVRDVSDPIGQSGWRLGSAPWRSILPFAGNPYASAAELLTAHFGQSSACLAWVSQERLRTTLPFHQHVHRLEPPLAQGGGELQGEDPYDRPGAALSDYDGAVVWAEAASGLPARVARGLGGATELGRVPLGPAFDTREALLFLYAAPGTDWAADGCNSRFPRTEIRALGTGWNAEGAHVPGLDE